MGPVRRYTLFALLSSALTALLLGLFVELYPMAVFDQSYPMYAQAKAASLRKDGRKASVVVLGDSRPKAAILTPSLGPNVDSLTLPGGTPIDLYFTLVRYLGSRPVPEHILISISPTHFRDGFTFWERAVKSNYLDDVAYVEVLDRAAAMGDDIFGSPREARWNYFAYRYRFLHIYLPELREFALNPGRSTKNHALFDQLSRRQGHTWFGVADRSDGLAYETTHETFDPTPVFDLYMRRLLSLSVQSGARVTFLAMPMNQRSDRAISRRFSLAYQRYFADLSGAYPDVAFDAAWPVLPDDHFGDANHVNPRGAAVTTERVRAFLKRARHE